MIRLNKDNNNEPALFNQDRYIGNLACHDMEREYMMAKHFVSGVYVSVGCLNSAMVPLMAERPGVDVIGVDFAEEVLAFLQPRFPKVGYMHHDIRSGIPFKDNSIDYIVAGEVIEHLENPYAFVSECMKALKPGGWLAISTPWEEGVKQGAVDREAHIWSYSIDDMTTLGFTEVSLLKDGAQTSIIAWQQK